MFLLSLESQRSFNSSTIGLNVKIDFNTSFFLKDHGLEWEMFSWKSCLFSCESDPGLTLLAL
ncbi:hypothetical protein BpHYR1_049947 [Brachionus plicatilis]|uniref:Uncharacterized protein n=1 Tax=Brachionus plicatilis TaxID=10195 RepID=A0A3M7P6W7_BRAPC|nr:hypothetical protein BpHYR1_049947 [Brachionus plicatilis]